MLAQHCYLLERAILRGAMKSGLEIAAQVLEDFEAVQGVSA